MSARVLALKIALYLDNPRVLRLFRGLLTAHIMSIQEGFEDIHNRTDEEQKTITNILKEHGYTLEIYTLNDGSVTVFKVTRP